MTLPVKLIKLSARQIEEVCDESSHKLPRTVWQTKEYSDYCDAIDSNKTIEEWYLRRLIKKSKVKVGRHCCTKMTYYLTFDKISREINPDAIVRFSKKSTSYGIPVNDGGALMIEIEYCPWCGARINNRE